jgi:hypothetical protein
MAWLTQLYRKPVKNTKNLLSLLIDMTFSCFKQEVPEYRFNIDGSTGVLQNLRLIHRLPQILRV